MNENEHNENQSYGTVGTAVEDKSGLWISYVKFWKNYVDFSGRSRRSDFWWVVLINGIIGIVAKLLEQVPVLGGVVAIIYLIYYIACIIPSISLSVRRLHDVGRSGFFYFLILIPFFGAVLLIIWFAFDSDRGENEYGPNPKGVTA